MKPMIETLGAMGLLAALACACGGVNGEDDRRINLPPRGAATAAPPAADPAEESASPAPSADPTPADPAPTPEPEPDADGDGVPDAVDCDPANAAIAGTKLIDDTLASDTVSFAPATGFPAASWAYETQAYRQTRLVDAADVTLFTRDNAIADVDVTVAAASTDVTSTIGPRLRQMFVLVGARVEGGELSAYGCGAEVVQGLSPEQRTSVVKLSGKPDAIVTTALQRTARNILLENEGFSIRAQLVAGKLTCTVSQGNNVLTTAEASGLADATGSIGFFTRQTKAAFKNVKACKLKAPVSAPK